MNTTTEMRAYIEAQQDTGLSLDDAYRALLTELGRVHDTDRFDTERESLVSLHHDGLKQALWYHVLRLQPPITDYRARPVCGQDRAWGFEAP